MMLVYATQKGKTPIGRLGENQHRGVIFPETKELLKMYPDAGIVVMHQRPGDPAAYPINPANVHIVDGCVCWIVLNSDVAYEGNGRCEVMITQGSVVALDIIYNTSILDALDGSATPPEPWESWIEQVVAAGQHAPTIIDGIWWAWDTVNEEYVNTGVPTTGADGRGIQSTVLNDDYTLTITYTDGNSVTTASIRGEQGEPGNDYVITQNDYNAIANIVATNAHFQDLVTSAQNAANLARNWADGKNLDGTDNPQHSENNAEY